MKSRQSKVPAIPVTLGNIVGGFVFTGWRGFHHHATLCIAAYGFLISERETIPPSGPCSTALRPQLAVPDGYRPRGSAVAA